MPDYPIQELTNQTNLPRRTIHFYVQQGLLPPPEGAGMAARYTETHLLCLKLIPLLRREGLKLDDIRARLRPLDEPGLRALFQELNQTPAPARIVAPISQAFAHYPLPAGMILCVPAAITPAERKKLAEVLTTISEIFSE